MKIRVYLWLLLLSLSPAFASAEIVFLQDAELFQDVDGSGDATCGDRVSLGLELFSRAPGDTDLTNVTITVDIPFQLTVLTAGVGSSIDNDCSFVGQPAGNPQIVVSCPFVCSTAGCESDGLTMSIVATIDNPNPRGSFTYQARMESDQGDLLAADRFAGSLDPPQATTFAYELCPATPEPDPADLVVTKRDVLVGDVDGDGLADPGDTVRYLVEVTGAGEENAVGVTFESDAPAGSALVAGSVATPLTVVSGNDPGDTRVVVTMGGLSPGLTRSLSFDVVVDDPPAGGIDELVCQGQASASNVPVRLSDDPDTAAGPDPTVTPLDFDPDVAIAKRADRVEAGAGEPIVFDLAVESVGTVGSTGVVVEETVPAHTRFMAALSSGGWSCADGAPAGTSCTLALGDLAVGASVERGFAVRVVDALPAGAVSTTNVATVADDGSQGPDPSPADNTDSVTVALVGEPAVAVFKTGPASAEPGEVVTYTIAFRNDGTREATGVVIAETVPDHSSFVAGASTPGWSCADGAPAGTVCELARASLPADGTERSVAFGVRLADTVPAGVEVVANRVTVTHDDPPGEPPGDEVETPVDAAPALGVEKSGPAVVEPGELVVYSLEVTNSGDQDAAAVTLTETVPALTSYAEGSSTAGWSCPDGAVAGTVCSFDLGTVVAGGGPREVTFAVRLAPAVPAGVEALVNAVLLREDGAPGPTDDVTSLVDAAPDLVVDKADGEVVVGPGGLVLYTFAIANAGDQDAAGVVVSDALPEWTTFVAASSTPGWSCDAGSPAVCTFELGGLAAGASAPPLVLALRLDPAVPFGIEEVVDVATVAGASGEEADPGDNTDTETTPVERLGGPEPEMAVVAATLDDAIDDADGDGALDPGEVLSYVAVVTNRGPAVAENVILSLPPDVHSRVVGSPTTTHGSVQVLGSGDGMVSAALGDLAADETATVTFEVELVEPVPALLAELVVQGMASLDNGPVAVTDDPATPAALDPTRTPVDAGEGVAVADVPTVSEVGLTVLAALLAVCGGWLLRRRREGTAEVTS